jgi:sorting nexin-41/42
LSEDDEEEYKQQQSGHLPKKGGYDGRIQQIIYENPDLEILITNAGKSPHGSFIEYRIRTAVC